MKRLFNSRSVLFLFLLLVCSGIYAQTSNSYERDWRTDRQKIKIISYNIMDYAISYSNQFTQNQRERIRHVLSYSPLIPGPKKGDIDTRALNEGPLDLPIRTIK